MGDADWWTGSGCWRITGVIVCQITSSKVMNYYSLSTVNLRSCHLHWRVHWAVFSQLAIGHVSVAGLNCHYAKCQNAKLHESLRVVVKLITEFCSHFTWVRHCIHLIHSPFACLQAFDSSQILKTILIFKSDSCKKAFTCLKLKCL